MVFRLRELAFAAAPFARETDFLVVTPVNWPEVETLCVSVIHDDYLEGLGFAAGRAELHFN